MIMLNIDTILKLAGNKEHTFGSAFREEIKGLILIRSSKEIKASEIADIYATKISYASGIYINIRN